MLLASFWFYCILSIFPTSASILLSLLARCNYVVGCSSIFYRSLYFPLNEYCLLQCILDGPQLIVVDARYHIGASLAG